MDEENNIRNFIRLQIYRGCGLEVIFNNLCLEFCGKSPELTSDEFSQWIKNLRFDVDTYFPPSSSYHKLLRDLQVFEGPPALEFKPAVEDGERAPPDTIPPQDFQSTLKILLNEFAKTKRSFESQRCASGSSANDCKMILLSERYAIDAGDDTNDILSFYLVDVLHNEKRELQINGDCASIKSVVKLYPLDSSYFICYTYHDRSARRSKEKDHFNVFLFRVDVAQLKCTLMDKHKIPSLLVLFIDIADPRKFIIYHRIDLGMYPENYEEWAQLCRLTTDGKLEFNEERLHLSVGMPDKSIVLYDQNYEIENDKIYGFCRSQDDTEIILFEAIFEESRLKLLQITCIPMTIRLEDHQNEQLLWSDDAFWMLKLNDKQQLLLYKFDVKSRQMTETKLSAYGKVPCAKIYNGTLIFCTINNDLQHAWHRILLSSQETLNDLSMERLRQEAIFMDEKEYAEFIQKLPAKLRPFGQSAATESEDGEGLEKPGS